MWLHYVEDMPAREIARVLGRSWASVKVMLFRARKRLLPLLGEFDDGPGRAAQCSERNAAATNARCGVGGSPCLDEIHRRANEPFANGCGARRPNRGRSSPNRCTNRSFRVRRHHAAVGAVHRTATAEPWQRGLVVLAAAACLLVAVAIGWRLLQTAAPQDRGGDVANDSRAWIERRQAIDQWADQTTTGLDGLVAFATPKPRESVLKHDARLVASTLLEPLPVSVPLAGEP